MNCRQVILLTAVVMVACADNPPAPIEDRSGGRSSTSTSARHARTGQNESAAIVGQPYTVRIGDTLTSIAFALGMHFKTLADINDISPPYAIYVGQTLQTRVITPSSPRAANQRAVVKPSGANASVIKVARGDTLYSLSKTLGMGASQLAAMNDLSPPYDIFIGQTLRTTANGKPPPSAVSTAKQSGVAAKTPPSTGTTASARGSSGAPLGPVARWLWPGEGKVIRSYSTNLHKGVDIAGRRGTPVKAAARGVVVYSGTGVKGYGALIIIKHNDDYLSAYGHNDAILVSEGATISAGQAIARMGSTGTDSVKLHFEIRRRGKPIDPLKILARR